MPGAPADAVVRADHVGHRRPPASAVSLKRLGLRDHIRGLVAAPTVALEADGLLIHHSAIHHRLMAGTSALESAFLARIAGVHDIRLEQFR